MPDVRQTMPAPDLSLAELIQDVIKRETNPEVVKTENILVGQLTDAVQQEGGVQITNAGQARRDPDAPIAWMRCQVRVVGPNLDVSERIAQHLNFAMDKHGRVEAVQRSTGKRYLIHMINVTAGPSWHFDSKETWENLMFLEVMIGLDPVL